MKLKNLVALSALILGTAAHAAPTLQVTPASLSADPGTTTGWSFSLTNDTSNFLLVTGSAFLPSPQSAFGTYADLTTDTLLLLNPGDTLTESFDLLLGTGLGAFTFAPSAHGYLSGNLEVFYSLFSADPFTVDDPSSVVVEEDAHADARTEARAIPEPTSLALVGLAGVAAFSRRRRTA